MQFRFNILGMALRISAVAAVLMLFGPAGLADDKIRAGDALSVEFFEAYGLTEPPPRERGERIESGGKVLYLRQDLSGELEVFPDGTIAVPLLGTVPVAGRTLSAVNAELLRAFAGKAGQQGELRLRIIRHAPVYVTGLVRAPGAFPFQDGMIVAQALALAGGPDQRKIAAAKLMELLRRQAAAGNGQLFQKGCAGSAPGPLPASPVSWVVEAVEKPKSGAAIPAPVRPKCNLAVTIYFEVVRGQDAGARALRLTETEPLQPGDVVRVRARLN